MPPEAETAADPFDLALLAPVEALARRAGLAAQELFAVGRRPAGLEEIKAAIHGNDEAVLAVLREPLQRLRPAAGWVEDELGGGDLPPGEWWIVDPLEGAINHLHGAPKWAVSVTLVRDSRPVLSVVHRPPTGETFTAVRGAGAHLDGARLRVSAKTDLASALVGTGQASPREDAEAHRRLAGSVAALLDAALVVRVTVPATLQLLQVAAGHADAFWQFSDVRSGLAAGALFVEQAGGTVSDVRGRPWTLASPDFLACAPGLHARAVQILSALA